MVNDHRRNNLSGLNERPSGFRHMSHIWQIKVVNYGMHYSEYRSLISISLNLYRDNLAR